MQQSLLELRNHLPESLLFVGGEFFQCIPLLLYLVDKKPDICPIFFEYFIEELNVFLGDLTDNCLKVLIEIVGNLFYGLKILKDLIDVNVLYLWVLFLLLVKVADVVFPHVLENVEELQVKLIHHLNLMLVVLLEGLQLLVVLIMVSLDCWYLAQELNHWLVYRAAFIFREVRDLPSFIHQFWLLWLFLIVPFSRIVSISQFSDLKVLCC